MFIYFALTAIVFVVDLHILTSEGVLQRMDLSCLRYITVVTLVEIYDKNTLSSIYRTTLHLSHGAVYLRE